MLLRWGQQHVSIELGTIALLHLEKANVGIFQCPQPIEAGIGALQGLLAIGLTTLQVEVGRQHFGAKVEAILVVDGITPVVDRVVDLDTAKRRGFQHVIVGDEVDGTDGIELMVGKRVACL